MTAHRAGNPGIAPPLRRTRPPTNPLAGAFFSSVAFREETGKNISMANKEQPEVETIPVPEIRRGEFEVTQDGVLRTPQEVEELERELREDPTRRNEQP